MTTYHGDKWLLLQNKILRISEKWLFLSGKRLEDLKKQSMRKGFREI